MLNELLRVEQLSSGYHRVLILNEVSFHVREGEMVAIIGPNGAGKTMLLKTISGLIQPASGRIFFNGHEISGQPPHAISRFGIAHVPEGGRLFPNMSVMENLLMGAYGNREVLKTGVLDELFELFPRLKERRHQLARTLSGGERQMLAIARGMASRPRLLMLDEPSLGLAPVLVETIYDRLRVLRERGLTILLVEQNIHYALSLADRGYVLENGHIVLEGACTALSQNPHIRQHYLGL